jgi:polyisoprenoid-binding protein YceI
MRRIYVQTISLIAAAALLLAACASSPSQPAGTLAVPPGAVVTTGVTPASSTGVLTTPAPVVTQVTQPQATSITTSTAAIQQTGSGNALTCVMTPGQNSASYKVREQLARLSFPTDAVGKTDQVSGQIVIAKDGTVDTGSSKFTVDLTSLQTDSSMRDNFVRRAVLQTDQYPQAVFVPKQVSGLPTPLPPTGDVSFKLSGDLTLHGVTKPVTWDVSGTANSGTANGTATTSFKFEDFNMQQPQVPVVLSVVDNITLEVTVSMHLAS